MDTMKLSLDEMVVWSVGQEVGAEAFNFIRDGLNENDAVRRTINERAYDDDRFPAITNDHIFIDGVKMGIRERRYSLGSNNV